MKLCVNYFSFIFIFVIFLSCSSSKENKDINEQKERSLIEFEKSFDPSKYELEYETSKPPSKKIETKNNTTKKSNYGFRIQISISDELSECQKKKNELQKLFPEYRFYILHEFPFYKLRLGDFQTRKEAEIHLKILNEKDIKNIMIVPDKINID